MDKHYINRIISFANESSDVYRRLSESLSKYKETPDQIHCEEVMKIIDEIPDEWDLLYSATKFK